MAKEEEDVASAADVKVEEEEEQVASAADVKVEEEEEQVASAVLHNPEDIPWHDRWTEWVQPEEISLDIVDEEDL